MVCLPNIVVVDIGKICTRSVARMLKLRFMHLRQRDNVQREVLAKVGASQIKNVAREFHFVLVKLRLGAPAAYTYTTHVYAFWKHFVR